MGEVVCIPVTHYCQKGHAQRYGPWFAEGHMYLLSVSLSDPNSWYISMHTSILAIKSRVLMHQRRLSASFACGLSLEAMVSNTHETTVCFSRKLLKTLWAYASNLVSEKHTGALKHTLVLCWDAGLVNWRLESFAKWKYATVFANFTNHFCWLQQLGRVPHKAYSKPLTPLKAFNTIVPTQPLTPLFPPLFPTQSLNTIVCLNFFSMLK